MVARENKLTTGPRGQKKTNNWATGPKENIQQGHGATERQNKRNGKQTARSRTKENKRAKGQETKTRRQKNGLKKKSI